jgi:hypothetical protein
MTRMVYFLPVPVQSPRCIVSTLAPITAADPTSRAIHAQTSHPRLCQRADQKKAIPERSRRDVAKNMMPPMRPTRGMIGVVARANIAQSIADLPSDHRVILSCHSPLSICERQPSLSARSDVKCEAWLSILFNSIEEAFFKPTTLLEVFLP